MEFRNIASPLYSEEYRVESIHHSSENKSLVIDLTHAYYPIDSARISFKDVLCTRYTPLQLCMSEYCERIGKFRGNNPEFSKMYSGIVEIVDYDEFKDKLTYAKSEGFMHYLIITEDEYVEVLSRFDPIIEVFGADEKKDE